MLKNTNIYETSLSMIWHYLRLFTSASSMMCSAEQEGRRLPGPVVVRMRSQFRKMSFIYKKCDVLRGSVYAASVDLKLNSLWPLASDIWMEADLPCIHHGLLETFKRETMGPKWSCKLKLLLLGNECLVIQRNYINKNRKITSWH